MKTLPRCLPILISILFIVKLSNENLINCGNCRNEESTLICPHYNETKYIVKLKTHENELEKYLQIDCAKLPILDFTHLEGCSFTSVEVVKLSFCPFFADSFVDIFDQIGIESSKVTMLAVNYPIGGVTSLSSTHLQKLTNLTYLNLEKTNLTHLSKDSFLHSPHLQMLYINGNDLKDIHPNIFDNLLALNILVMNGNGLRKIPRSLFQNLKDLENIYFETNKIVDIPGNLLEKLPSLKILSFYDNLLSTIPVNLFTNNSFIEAVYFSYNKLTYLPEQLFKTNMLLKNIEFDRNFITTIPQFLFNNLIHLKSLKLSNNQINSLSGNLFDSLTQLKVIHLNNNNLVTLPDNIFRKCFQLEDLNLANNNLVTLKFNEFPNAPTLIKIDLSHNRLTSREVIDDNNIFALNFQTSLQYVDLSYNKFDSFANFGWSSFVELNILNFEGNNLREITFKEIFALPSDSVLNLANNNLERIVGDIPAGYKIMKIYLKDNNLNCDCFSFYLLEQIQENERISTLNTIDAYGNSKSVLNVLDRNELICQRPEKLYNLELISLHLRDLECILLESDCSYACPCTYNPFYDMITINCAHNNLTAIPEVMYLPMFIYTLDLSGNNLSSFNLSSETEIRTLNISNNNLRANEFKTERNLPMNLSVLDLSDNEFTSVPSSFLSELNSMNNLVEIDLSANPWICDCDINPLHDFIQLNMKKIKNIRSIKCGMEHLPLIDLTDEDTCPLIKQPKILAIVGSGTIMLIFIAVIGTASFFHFRTPIKIWLFAHRMCLWLITEREVDADKTYDAFISYAHQDEKFVINELLDGLENGDPKYRICLHYRDWIVGEFIPDQIIKSVHNSRRTIVVLSENFIESVWGQMEFRVAHQQALKENTNRVIVIVLGEISENEKLGEELRHYISMRTYLKSDHPKFWDRLRYAMPHPQNYSRNR